MSILCAVDFSAGSAVALRTAARISAAFSQRLTVTTVADPLLVAAERVQVGEDPLALLTGALREFIDDTLGPGLSLAYHPVVPLGNPAVEICRQADELDAQLVVLATRGETGVGKVVVGSVAERVLRTTTRPVLVVPPSIASLPIRTLGEMHDVLAPIDFHEHAVSDARVAQRVARASGAQLRLLHVVPDAAGDRWTVLRPPVAAQLEAQLRGARHTEVGRAHEALRRLAGALDGEPPPELEVVQGRVVEQIAHAADRSSVDLVVMGLRGTPGLLGARVGAVAYRVLSTAPVPVLALPHEAREDALAFLESR